MSTHCYATMKISLSELVTETLEVGRIRNFVLVISDKCYISLVHGLCLSGVSRNFQGGGRQNFGAPKINERTLFYTEKIVYYEPNFIANTLFCFSNFRGDNNPLPLLFMVFVHGSSGHCR